MKTKIILLFVTLFILNNCGKVGPLVLPKDKLNKSILSYPCNEECMQNFEAEKIRQESVKISTDQ